MTDYDYWKKKYHPTQDASARREQIIAERLERLTGRKVRIVGFGAGSEEFLPGTAKSHGYEKGEPDLLVGGTNIVVEVTGPNVPVRLTDTLWIRPDKIANAKAHIGDKETWVAHCLADNSTVRVIKIDKDFINEYEKGIYKTGRHSTRRGTTETMVEVPADEKCVRKFEILVERIKSWKDQSAESD